MSEGSGLSKTSFYVDPNKIRLLKSRLALDGLSISGWMRIQIDKFLKKGGNNGGKKAANG